MSRLEPMLGVLCQEGFGPLEGEYYEAWLHSGQEVRIERTICGGVVLSLQRSADCGRGQRDRCHWLVLDCIRGRGRR